MKKKILTIFVSFLMVFSLSAPIGAEEKISLDIGNLSIIDDTTLYNSDDSSYYTFSSEEDMREFLAASYASKNMSKAPCLPGDPGYPNCNGDAVVSVTYKTISSSTTGYILSKNYLLGNGGWCFGPGDYGISIGKSFTANFGVNYKKFTANISFGVTATNNYSYHVYAGQKGNVKYKSRFTVSEIQPVYKLESGKVTYGKSFMSSKRIVSGGGFTKVVLPA